MHAIRVVAFAKFSVDILQKQMSTKALELVERWNVSKSEIQVERLRIIRVGKQG
jgi:hypothetical protein